MGAKRHLLPFALVYGACGLGGETCLMGFLTLVFPKRIRQIFYSLAAKMCDFIVQKMMSFNLTEIVFLLGIPHIFYSLSVIWIVTFSNLIIFISQSYAAFNETVFNNFSFWS